MRKTTLAVLAIAIAALAWLPVAAAAQDKPNILVIFGDDVGMYNISAYHRGMMGGSTPNIDRIANEGAMFTDYYAQQSCTAGRAAFILGQHPYRTGLLTIGMPGAKEGISEKDPTLAELLKPHGYMTATSTTSMPRRSRRPTSIRKTRNSTRNSARAACSRQPPTARSKTPGR
jgi:arylsulfatase